MTMVYKRVYTDWNKEEGSKEKQEMRSVCSLLFSLPVFIIQLPTLYLIDFIRLGYLTQANLDIAV